MENESSTAVDAKTINSDKETDICRRSFSRDCSDGRYTSTYMASYGTQPFHRGVMGCKTYRRMHTRQFPDGEKSFVLAPKDNCYTSSNTTFARKSRHIVWEPPAKEDNSNAGTGVVKRIKIQAATEVHIMLTTSGRGLMTTDRPKNP